MATPERLTLFFDIAGRVTRTSVPDNYFTVGGLIIPSSKEDEFRRSIDQHMPKWKEASARSLDAVQSLLDDRDVLSIVLTIEKTQPAWDQFWTDGAIEHRKLTSLLNEKVGFSRPGTVTKYVAFGGCAAIVLGEQIRRHGLPKLLDKDEFRILRLRVILDTDIEGDDNQDTFRYMWKRWADSTKMKEVLGIRPVVDVVEFRAEQDDPILLLPDYLAGWAYYAVGKGSVNPPTALDVQAIDEFGHAIKAIDNVLAVTWRFGEQFPNLTTASTRTGFSAAAPKPAG